MKKDRRRVNLGFSLVLFFCSLTFLFGFFVSFLFSQNSEDSSESFQSRLLSTKSLRVPHGETGESDLSSIPFQILSWKPRALYFPKFASIEQCRGIISMAKLSLEPSKLALREGETIEKTEGIRTSTGTFISASEDSTGILDYIEQKIAKVTMIPKDHGEAFNVLRYEIGQHYASHYDAFDPAQYGQLGSQRIATFLLYLSDVEEGGETMFPFENGLNMDGKYDFRKCIGLKVKPRQGDGLLFYSLLANGTIDRMSLHGSCPVVKGEKWVATKWIKDQIEEIF